MIYWLVSDVAGILLICLGVAMLQSAEGLLPGLAFVLAGSVELVWVSCSLVVTRPHDMSLAGTHLIWIILLNLAAAGTGQISPGIAYLLGVVSFGVNCWLLIKRGATEPNEYGVPPGAARWRPGIVT